MPKRYLQEQIKQIENLVAQGLSNTEIAQHLGRAEAGIRNIRHRLKLKTNTQNQFQPLLREKKELEKKVQEQRQTQTQLSWQLDSLQRRTQETQTYLKLDQLTLEQKLQTALTELKTKKPELFYITGTEQIAKLAVYFIQWLFS
jgi:DNA-binding CsgD family transcriptional regulator